MGGDLRLDERWRHHCDFVACHAGGGLIVHPAIHERTLKAPAIAELERWNRTLGGVLVEGIRADSQIFGCLADIHHFPGFTDVQTGLHGGSPLHVAGLQVTATKVESQIAVWLNCVSSSGPGFAEHPRLVYILFHGVKQDTFRGLARRIQTVT